MEILLDTNFIIYMFRYKLIDSLISLHPRSILVYEGVISELKKLVKSKKGDEKEYARRCLIMIDHFENEHLFSIVPSSSKYTDDSILDLAMDRRDGGNDVFVATLDNWLIKKLKKAKIGILGIRQKKYLIIN